MANIHHLNCGTLQPYFPKLKSIVYCLLLASNQGLVLIDTGFGMQDYTQPSMKMRVFLAIMGVPRNADETAMAQVRALGYQPSDVKHIVLTHLHLDHAGGLPDFPDAMVHVYRTEYEAMLLRKGLLSWGYDTWHFRHNVRWVFHEVVDGAWFGFPSLSIIDGLKPSVRLIPLPGHTHGHCGVAIETDRGWLLHCGDAASPFHKHTSILTQSPDAYRFPHLPRWFTQWVMGSHVTALRELAQHHGDEIDFISGHDIYSYERLRVTGI